jgi:hypothetical protein
VGRDIPIAVTHQAGLHWRRGGERQRQKKGTHNAALYFLLLRWREAEPLGTSAARGPLYQFRIIFVDERHLVIGKMRIGRVNRSAWRKPAPVPLWPSQVPYELIWDWIWATEMRSRGAMVDHCCISPEWRWQVKLSLYLIKQHNMKTCGGVETAPCTLHLGTRLLWVSSLAIRPHFPEKSTASDTE